MIAPVALFKLNPPGKAPDTIEYAIVLSDVADTVKLAVPPAAKEPKLPAAVFHVGESETVNKAVVDLTAKPSLFSTLK